MMAFSPELDVLPGMATINIRLDSVLGMETSNRILENVSAPGIVLFNLKRDYDLCTKAVVYHLKLVSHDHYVEKK